MPDEAFENAPSAGRNILLRVIPITLAVVYVLVSAYFMYDLNRKLTDVQAKQKITNEDQERKTTTIMKQLGISESNLKQSLESGIGQTRKEVFARTAELRRQQQAAEQRLRQETQQQVAKVSGEIGGVKTDLTGAKGDIAATRSDLEATKMKLDRAMGDLGQMSGLIAHTRDELDVLRHRGDRNYYEFTLQKGARPTPLSTVSLQLKKVNAKKGKFTMNVIADDRTIEKKDRTLLEPMQFITGRDRNLYEVVVFGAEKNKIMGYLSTPKIAPTSVAQ